VIFRLFLDTRNRGENRGNFGVILLLSQYIAKKIIRPGFLRNSRRTRHIVALGRLSCFGKDLVRLLHNHKS
jgi:hypothetical protein